MTWNKLFTALTAAALAFGAALGACGCMISAFDLELVGHTRVILAWGLGSLFCAGAFSWKKGGILVLPAAVLGAGYLWRQGDFPEQLWQLVYRLTHIYDQAYHWGVFKLVETPWDAGTAELPMLVLGLGLSAVTARSVCRRQSALYPVGLCLLPLISCAVVTDTVPAPEFLYLLLLVLILLLLTGQVRKTHCHQADQLAVLALLPTALLLGGLFLAVPESGYVNHTKELREHLVSWLQSLPESTGIPVDQGPAPAPAEEPQRVDLASLGSRRDSTVPVMEVTAETGGSLYLRGQDYDRYDGAGWTASPNRVEKFHYDGVRMGYVSVTTRREQDNLYLPYYPRDGLSFIGGAYGNTRMARDYSFLRMGLPENWRELAAAGEAPSPREDSREERYLALPESTRAQLAPLANSLTDGLSSTAEKAGAIGAYVRSTVPYSKHTQRMPDTAPDFVLWFLEESETGYCIHFATTAAVLLRAAGIEARFVSGYMVAAQPEKTVTVTGEQAHAWAEYYEPGLGTWVILEATPPEGTPAPTEPHTPETLPTAAPTVSAATIPTQPPEAPTEEIPETTITTEPAESLPSRAAPAAPGIPRALLWIGLLALGTEGQSRLRVWLRRRYLGRGSPNRRALKAWREAERLAKHLRQNPPEALDTLAQKAKFSQHTLTGQELHLFAEYLSEARKQLRERTWYCRLLYRYIFALF